jgi:hypothetical protein
MAQQCEYTFEIMTTDGLQKLSFNGDITTSSFVSNYIKDMGIENTHIELVAIGERNMSAHDIAVFYATWQYLSGTDEGCTFAKNINPEYFEEYGSDQSEFLPADLNDILTPTEQDIIQHKEWLTTVSNVNGADMDTNIDTIKLLKMMPFLRLVNCINYANFFGIDSMIQLFAKLIAEYTKIFIKIRRV